MENEKVKKTWDDLRLFFLNGAAFGGRKDNIKSKTYYAIKKLMQKYQSEMDDYHSELEDEAKVPFCSVDSDKNIIYDVVDKQRFYKFTQENQIKVNKKEREILKKWKAKELEIEPYYVSSDNLSLDLTDYEIEIFTGFIIKEGVEIKRPEIKTEESK